MQPSIIPREEVAERLSIPAHLLIRYEARGLVSAIREGPIEGYGPAEIRRVWTIVSFQRDLGINLAGVEAILKLRDHLEQVHERLAAMAQKLHEAVESEPTSDDA